jgi:hypothetical protein
VYSELDTTKSSPVTIIEFTLTGIPQEASFTPRPRRKTVEVKGADAAVQES